MKKWIFALLFFSSIQASAELTVNIALAVGCDPIWRPPGCVPPEESAIPSSVRSEVAPFMDMKYRLRDMSGINLVTRTNSVPEFRRGIYVISSTGASRVEREATATNRAGDTDNNTDNTTPENTEPNAISPSSNGGAGSGFNQNGGGPSLTPPPSSNFNQGGLQVRNGMIFSGDAPEEVQKPQVVTNNSVLERLPIEPGDPIAQNLQNAGDEGDGSGAAVASLGRPGSGFVGAPSAKADNGPATPGKAKPKPDGLYARLKSLAQGLGSKFFGASSTGSNGQGPVGTTLIGSGKNKNKVGKKLASADGHLMDLDGMLQKHASRNAEFSASNLWLFGDMCEHWRNLAREDQLPDNKANCPR